MVEFGEIDVVGSECEAVHIKGGVSGSKSQILSLSSISLCCLDFTEVIISPVHHVG